MLDKQIRKIKIFFALVACAMFFLIVWGTFALKDNSLFTAGSFFRTVDFVKYKIAFNRNGVIDWITDIPKIVKQPEVYAVVNGPKGALSVPVLAYHGVLHKSDGSEINLTQKKFAEQMSELKKAGYHAISTEELYTYLRGEISLPENSFLITFDDGRTDSYEKADPVLRALKFKASMFVIGKYSIDSDSDYYLSTSDLKRMSNSETWDIQAHSHDGHSSYPVSPSDETGHFYASRFWLSSEGRLETRTEFEKRIENDFKEVKDKLSSLIKKDVIAFAFPFGDYGQNDANFPEAKNISLTNGVKHYKLLFYQNAPGQRFTSVYYLPEIAQNESFLVKRIIIDDDWNGKDIVAVLNNSKAKQLPYIDGFKTNNGWLTSWGSVSVDPELSVMTIKPGSDQVGGSVVLDGTRIWKNYKLTSLVNVPNQNSVFVWVRFKDDQNNVACNFGEGFAHVEQTKDGRQSVIRGVRNENFILPKGDFEVGVVVNDRKIDCLVNGNVVVSSDFIDPELDSGGIGFKTWDTVSNRSLLLVKKVEVEKI